MKNPKETSKIASQKTLEIKNMIIDLIMNIEDEKFLNQIRIILKRHIEKRGD